MNEPTRQAGSFIFYRNTKYLNLRKILWKNCYFWCTHGQESETGLDILDSCAKKNSKQFQHNSIIIPLSRRLGWLVRTLQRTSRSDHLLSGEPPALGESYLSIPSHPSPREGGIMLELCWNCLEFFFAHESRIFNLYWMSFRFLSIYWNQSVMTDSDVRLGFTM